MLRRPPPARQPLARSLARCRWLLLSWIAAGMYTVHNIQSRPKQIEGLQDDHIDCCSAMVAAGPQLRCLTAETVGRAVAGVTWDFRAHEKIAPGKGGRFFHARRAWKICPPVIYSRSPSVRNRPSVVWPWEIRSYGSFLFILWTLFGNCIFISLHNIKLLKHSKSILW